VSFVRPHLELGTKDFAAGFLDSPETNALPPGATPDAANCFFDRIGGGASLKKRNGHRLLNPTAISAGDRIDGLTEFTRPGYPSELIAVCNGIAYKWVSGSSSFVALTGGTGFTPGNRVGFAVFRTQLYIYDGTHQLRYNGTACLPVGFIAPTSATAMAVAVPSGSGVTGTYESFYVWYDSTADHESSPTEATAAVVFTADARRHTKPGGSPPANVTHWRAYVRRTDTYEGNYYFAAAFTVASATGDEEVSDTARRIPGPGPASASNDMPPDSFAGLAAWRGYMLGFKTDDFNLYVSKQGDGESWNPKDVFPIRAGGREIRCVRCCATELLVQTPRRTFHLVGARVPFAIEELSAEWGCVSQDASVEVAKWYYAWDEQRGPYRTDTLNWESLVDNRIEGVVASVNRSELHHIRAEVFPKANLVVWIVSTDTYQRSRLVLAYDYVLEAWLPPITGFEYGSLARYTEATGETGLYMGDEWGRVYEMFSGTVDGPPDGTLEALVTSATASTVTCGLAEFYTTGSGLAGMPVACVSAAGAVQWRRIQSNTATTITLDTTNDVEWGITPEVDWTILVGGINWYWTSPWFDGAKPGLMKRGAYLMIEGRASAQETAVTVYGRFNDVEANRTTKSYVFGSADAGSVWGVAIWGASYWGGGSGRHRKRRKQRIGRSFESMQFRVRNIYPDQDFTLVSYQITADLLMRRVPRNV
jgi:hypothetical protein